MAARRILVVEDDADVRDSVRTYLLDEGYDVRAAADGEEGLRLARSFQPHLVVLDITLDNGYRNGHEVATRAIDGLTVLRRLRAESRVFVLMLTGTSLESIKVMALKLGADDYVTKPFGLPELGARIEAILRRAPANDDGDRAIVTRHLRIDPDARRAWRGEEQVQLTRIEFDLLLALAEHRGQVLSREQLIWQVWGHEPIGDERLIDAHIRRVRKKVEADPSRPRSVVTVRGVGYRLDG